MPYTVPRSKASIKQNRFEFTIEDDKSKKVYSVPLLKFLPPSLILSSDSLGELAFAKLLFEKFMPDAFEKFGDADQLQDFMKAWSDASGVSAGESEASPA